MDVSLENIVFVTCIVPGFIFVKLFLMLSNRKSSDQLSILISSFVAGVLILANFEIFVRTSDVKFGNDLLSNILTISITTSLFIAIPAAIFCAWLDRILPVSKIKIIFNFIYQKLRLDVVLLLLSIGLLFIFSILPILNHFLK